MYRILPFALLLAGPAMADGDRRLSNAELYPPLPGVEYFCKDANGFRYELGQSICITASCQTWMATCSMSQNNTTWRKVTDGCPMSDNLIDRMKKLAS